MTSSVQPVIVTADLERLVAFYTDVFGATTAERFPPEGEVFYVGLLIGDSPLGLVSDTGAADAPAGTILLDIGVDDVAAALAKVEAAGGTAKGQPNEMPWGQVVAHAEDPDGHTINISAPV